jgi:hypothetical protein
MPTGGEAQVIATELERVETKVPILFERDDTFFSQIERRPGEIVSSISMRQPLELRPGGKNRAWNSDGGDKGLGGLPDYDKAEINTVELEHAMQWTSRRKYGTDNTRKAVINSFRRDLASGMAEFRRFNDSLCMTAGNGVMATVTTATASGGFTTITLTTDGFGAKLLRDQDDYNVWDPTITTLRTPNETTIVYYDEPNKTIQVIDPSTIGGSAIQAGDVILPSGYQTSPPASILGVPYHDNVSSVGTWLGFNRATTPNIRANGVTAGGGLALPFARLAINKIGNRVGIKTNYKLTAWCHPCQAQAYEEIAQEAIIINKEDKEEGIDLYFNDNMRLAGAPIKRSYSWDKTRIDFINYDVWARAEFYPCRFYRDDNGNRYFPMRGASGGVAASNLAYIDCSWNLYVTNPAGASYISALTVPAGY